VVFCLIFIRKKDVQYKILVGNSAAVKARKIALELVDNGRTAGTVRDGLDFVAYLPKDALAATDCLFVSFVLSQLVWDDLPGPCSQSDLGAAGFEEVPSHSANRPSC
jgi:hypothetical protein